jgi:hypothetical protein
MTRLMLIIAAMLTLAGCKGDPPPEAVARSFYEICEVGRQSGPAAVQNELFGLLSQASQDGLTACAERLTKSLKLEPPMEAADCLIFDSYSGVRRDFESRRVADGEERVRLEVTSGGTPRILELVHEDGWRIDLAATVALNEAQTSPAP